MSEKGDLGSEKARKKNRLRLYLKIDVDLWNVRVAHRGCSEGRG